MRFEAAEKDKATAIARRQKLQQRKLKRQLKGAATEEAKKRRTAATLRKSARKEAEGRRKKEEKRKAKKEAVVMKEAAAVETNTRATAMAAKLVFFTMAMVITPATQASKEPSGTRCGNECGAAGAAGWGPALTQGNAPCGTGRR